MLSPMVARLCEHSTWFFSAAMQEIDGYALLQLSQTDLGSNLMLKLGPARTVHSCIPHFCSSLALS